MATIDYELIVYGTNKYLYKFKATNCKLADKQSILDLKDVLARKETTSELKENKTLDDAYTYTFSCQQENLTVKELCDVATLAEKAGFILGKNMAMVSTLKFGTYAKKTPKNTI